MCIKYFPSLKMHSHKSIITTETLIAINYLRLDLANNSQTFNVKYTLKNATFGSLTCLKDYAEQ